MKRIIPNLTALCLITYACFLSIVVFWRASGLLMSSWPILAALGWLAWWLERYWWHDEASSQVNRMAEADNPAEKANLAELSGKTSIQEAAVTVVPGLPNEMAAQIRVMLDEAEEAVALSIQSFKHITLELREMAQCAREMMNWGSEKSPMIHSALAHLSERGEAISQNAQGVVTAFQFHDLLRQRMEGIAAFLEAAPIETTPLETVPLETAGSRKR